MPKVTIRYWAAAKEAAGMSEESVTAATLAEALDAALASRAVSRSAADGPAPDGPAADGGASGGQAGDGPLREVLARSSFLVDGTRANKASADLITLGDGAVIEILPPFAGG